VNLRLTNFIRKLAVRNTDLNIHKSVLISNCCPILKSYIHRLESSSIAYDTGYSKKSKHAFHRMWS